MKTNGHTIGRREFLLVSSTCALAAAAVGPKLFGEEAVAQPKRLAVGFAALDVTESVYDAMAVSSADRGFLGRGARVAVAGSSGGPAEPQARRGVELLAHFSIVENGEQRFTPFRAWGCNRSTGCQGNPTNFTVPVDEMHQIRLSVGVETGASGAPASRRNLIATAAPQADALPLSISLVGEPGSFKLVRGHYVIVPLFENDAEPRWSDWKIGRNEGRMALVDAAGTSAPFEHFVLRINYAS